MRIPLQIWLATIAAAGSVSAGAQAQQAASSSWSGWARCQVVVQGPGYSDQQTHTWKITGGAPVVQGAFREYAATWSVVGQGSLTRTQANQTLHAEWATNGPEVSAPIAVFVRASDNRTFIQSRHAQLRNPSATQGYQQLTIAGVPQKPATITTAAFEWAFPMIAVSAPVPPSTNATASGSNSAPIVGSVGLMQPAGSTVTSACNWNFGEGSAAPAPPAVLIAPPVPLPGSLANDSRPPSGTPPAMVAVPLDPGVLTMPRLCTLRGPGPMSGSASYTTPRSAHLRWAAVGGAVGYTVSRGDLGILTPQPLPATTTAFIHEAVFQYPQTYLYTVTANYPEGCGKTEITLKAPQLKTPPVGARSGNQPGHVILVWHWSGTTVDVLALDDYDGVLITGPTLPASGREVKHNRGPWEQTDIYGVPAGTHTWTAKAYWDLPGGRIMDSSGRTVTSTVP